MQWLIVACHGTNAARLEGSGHMPLGGALRDVEGRMIGSAGVARFETGEGLEARLCTAPCVAGNVLQGVQITPYRVAPRADFPPCPQATPDTSRERP